MKSKKYHVAKHTKKQSFLSLDFLKHPKLPFRGTVSGLALIIVGWLIAVTAVIVIGILIFVPSVGSYAMKFLRKNGLVAK